MSGQVYSIFAPNTMGTHQIGQFLPVPTVPNNDGHSKGRRPGSVGQPAGPGVGRQNDEFVGGDHLHLERGGRMQRVPDGDLPGSVSGDLPDSGRAVHGHQARVARAPSARLPVARRQRGREAHDVACCQLQLLEFKSVPTVKILRLCTNIMEHHI